MIYFANGTFNPYNTLIETATIAAATQLQAAHSETTVMLMQPDETTGASLTKAAVDVPVITLPDWLQGVTPATRGQAQPALSQYRSEQRGDQVAYYDDDSLVATQQQRWLTYVDARGRQLERDYYDPRGFLSQTEYFDDANHLTERVWLTASGQPALTISYDESQQPVLYTVAQWPGVYHTATALWSASLARLVSTGDTVVSMRREYDSAVLALPAEVKKVAGIYRGQPKAATAFTTLVTDIQGDWVAALAQE